VFRHQPDFPYSYLTLAAPCKFYRCNQEDPAYLLLFQYHHPDLFQLEESGKGETIKIVLSLTDQPGF